MQEIQSNLIGIIDKDYDVEFSLDSKIFDSYCNQLSGFGEIINMYCGEEMIQMSTQSIDANMDIQIPIDMLSHYEIVEDLAFDSYNNAFDNKY